MSLLELDGMPATAWFYVFLTSEEAQWLAESQVFRLEFELAVKAAMRSSTELYLQRSPAGSPGSWCMCVVVRDKRFSDMRSNLGPARRPPSTYSHKLSFLQSRGRFCGREYLRPWNEEKLRGPHIDCVAVVSTSYGPALSGE